MLQEGTELSVHQQGFCLCQCQHDPAPGKTCKLTLSAAKAKARMKAIVHPKKLTPLNHNLFHAGGSLDSGSIDSLRILPRSAERLEGEV